ncbi:MAG: winged helix DNA-binding domain-containing protein [Actinomycetota bacterium]|nr:winged helix DNA-binding domain-containing protein [Actinomycetota bacterium]
MTLRTLTERDLNRALLERQLLLERAALPISGALERIGGLQTQYAPSAYVGLWSRLVRFERAQLTSALERRNAVQATLMRSTIHIVSKRDFRLFAVGVRRARREWWLRVSRGGADARAMQAVAQRLRNLLADGVPERRTDLIEELGVDTATWNGIGLWVDLVRAPPSGTWVHRRADLFASADAWLGPSDATESDGIEHLVRRYLGGFGPASARDVASWAGVPLSMLTPAFDRMRLRRFRDERGGELLDLQRAPIPDPQTPAPVRFLPTWDATLLVHARRTQILPEPYRALVFNTRTPHSLATFLVDGRVAGTWTYERGGVRTSPFAPLPKEIRRGVAEEAERLAEFHR